MLWNIQAEEKKAAGVAAAAAAAASAAAPGPQNAQGKGGNKEGGAYIAPALREGGNRRGETMATGRRSKQFTRKLNITFR